MTKKNDDAVDSPEDDWSVRCHEDCVHNMMKFQQRLVLITAVALVITTCLIFLANNNFDGWMEPKPDSFVIIRDLHLRELNNIPTYEPDKCTRYDDQFREHANLSALHLRSKNNYQLVNGGQYILPSMAPTDDPPRDSPPLKVILMPHSHNDPGWLRTIEEYYVYSTKKILNNMVSKLRMYPNMTFVWAETVFLTIWWNELEDDVKAQVRRLVRNGQLEIVLGGWVMPDEASTHYYSVIEQLMEGHQWVLENLHVKPRNSWSIDPFGHSGTMPYLWRKSGLQNMVIQRIHQATKASLASHGGLEFMWRQPWDEAGKWDIFCHVMPYMLYNVKHTCGPNPLICLQFDFRPVKTKRVLAEPISLKNVEIQARFLYEQYRRKASLYKHNVILVPIGDDFRYDSAEEWDQQFHNYNMLARYMNTQPKWNIEVKFGTLQDYFDTLKETSNQAVRNVNDKKLQFPTLTGDFFPYSDKEDAYWTGYYSTRPFDKRFSREVEVYLRSADILNVLSYAMSRRENIAYDDYHDVAHFLQQSRRNLGLFLHHDGITGTSKEYVVQDFENKLYYAYNASQKVVNRLTQFLLSKGKVSHPRVFHSGVSRDSMTSVAVPTTVPVTHEGTQVVLFNPTARRRNEMVSLIVNADDIVIKNAKKAIIPIQINPVWETATVISPTKFEVVFLADLAPLSLTPYFIQKGVRTEPSSQYLAKVTIYNSLEFAASPDLKFNFEKPRHSGNFKDDIVLESETVSARFSSRSGMLKHITDKITGNKTDTDISFLKYKSRGSGAYLFFPYGEAEPFLKKVPIIHVVEGPLVSKIEVLYENVEHMVTLYNLRAEQGRGLHIRNRVDMHANRLKNLKDAEIIMRVNCDIKNKDLEFYTDQNGFQLIKRRTDPQMYIEANYYPVTNMVLLEDAQRRITLHSGQSHGVAALSQGQFEVMLDRELQRDDNRGLSEGVGDNKLTDTFFVLQVEYRDRDVGIGSHKSQDYTFPSLLSHHVNDILQHPVISTFTTISSDVLQTRYHPLKSPLPCDVHIVSMKNLINSDLQYMNSSVIFHKRGYVCDFPFERLHCPLHNNFSFSSLFKNVELHNVRKTTLTHMDVEHELTSESTLSIPKYELAAYTFNII